MTVYTTMNTIGEKECLVTIDTMTITRPDITTGLPDTGLPMRWALLRDPPHL
jgi:hypothetical protein